MHATLPLLRQTDFPPLYRKEGHDHRFDQPEEPGLRFASRGAINRAPTPAPSRLRRLPVDEDSLIVYILFTYNKFTNL